MPGTIKCDTSPGLNLAELGRLRQDAGIEGCRKLVGKRLHMTRSDSPREHRALAL